MPTLLAHPTGYDAVDAYADLNPAILASLRTPADETALTDAVETQLTARATRATALEVPAQRRRAPSVEQRAA